MLAKEEKEWYNAAKVCFACGRHGTDMGEPQYRLEGIVRTRTEELEDFEGPLDVIFLLLSKNKIEIQDVSISAILEQ